MAWRFKVSKYKNATPMVPKKEDWLSDVKIGSPQSCGNHVSASAAFVAFNVENRGGGSLGVFPLEHKGRMDASAPLLHAHSDLITDFQFSPFDDGMLATCSTDANVHIWHIPEGGLTASLSTPEYSLPQFDRRVENVLFHPSVDCLLTVACFETVKLWDIAHKKEVYCYSGHEDQIQSTSWNLNGGQFVTTSKDRKIRVIDPRTNKVAMEGESHRSPKDSRVVWLGSTDRILSSGWDASRIREVRLRDLRNFNNPYKVQGFDSSTGILMPLFDADTNMLFLAGKADVSIMVWEIMDNEPYLIEGLKHNGQVQTKGACIVPKRGLDVMNGEVNRVMQLTSNALIPITYQVPRKTYREFHSDLFPNTRGYDSAMIISQWLSGGTTQVPTVSLNPANRQTNKFQMHRGPLSQRAEPKEVESTPVPAPRSRINGQSDGKLCDNRTHTTKPMVAVKETDGEKTDDKKPVRGISISQLRKNYETNITNKDEEEKESEESESTSKLASIRKQFENRSMSLDERKRDGSCKREDEEKENVVGDNKTVEHRPILEHRVCSVDETPSSPNTPRRPTLSRSFRRVCKFRHLKGSPGHKKTWIENLRDLSQTTPSESDGLACNQNFVCLPLSGGGGRLLVLPHNKPGRLPDGVIPAILNSANVLDFAFDPFNPHTLLAGCDDGKMNLWHIPEAGLSQPTNEPTETFMDIGASEKVTIVKYHPLASGVLASVMGDHSVKLWDIHSRSVPHTLPHHKDQVFSCSWSPCGRYLVTLCRDGSITVFDPRHTHEPVVVGSGCVGGRGGRVLWAAGGKLIVTVGFTKRSERQISVHSGTDLKSLNSIGVDISPAMLIPHYDPDSSTLFATGKGDSTIYAYEIGLDMPHLFPLSHHKCNNVHQGLTMLPKTVCDVKAVEFCRMLRLTSNVLEPLSFTVPRVKTEYFQDDIFPPTRVTWEPSMTSIEWLGGTNRQPSTLSLKPNHMTTLSESREQPPSPQTENINTTKPHHIRHQTPPFLKGVIPSDVRQTQHKLEESLSQQMNEEVSIVLEQDKMEGVDSTEWVSTNTTYFL